MKNKLLILISILFIYAAQSHAFSVNIDPPSIYTKGEQGERVISKITIENTSNEAIKVKVYPQDWLYRDDNSKQFLELGKTPYSLNKSLTLYAQEIVLTPNERQEVLFEIKTSETQKGGLYGVIFFETSPVLKNASSSVQLIGRIGSIIYHEIQDTQVYQFDVILQKTDSTKQASKLYLNLINQSNVHLNLKGSLLILTQQKQIIDRIPIENFKALPNEKRTIVLTTKSLPKGITGLLTLTYEGQDLPYTKIIEINN